MSFPVNQELPLSSHSLVLSFPHLDSGRIFELWEFCSLWLCGYIFLKGNGLFFWGGRWRLNCSLEEQFKWGNCTVSFCCTRSIPKFRGIKQQLFSTVYKSKRLWGQLSGHICGQSAGGHPGTVVLFLVAANPPAGSLEFVPTGIQGCQADATRSSLFASHFLSFHWWLYPKSVWEEAAWGCEHGDKLSAMFASHFP